MYNNCEILKNGHCHEEEVIVFGRDGYYHGKDAYCHGKDPVCYGCGRNCGYEPLYPRQGFEREGGLGCCGRMYYDPCVCTGCRYGDCCCPS